ncbi:rhomboid domain-containing protein 2 isoform X2 [Melanerpes formicivorus]|uniref:rhomboid domain-containing protein 2 isoform X2 n=1 Tax=Melanerpes formicivorus TaxID=211600 RepID=UPI00358F47D9
MAAGLGPPPAATALTLLLSIGVSAPGLLRGPPAARSAASLRAAALRAGEVHRLLTYIFLYEDLASLACGAVVVWYFAGGFERSVGTAKHCVLTAAFTVLAALLYLLLEAFVSRLSEVEEAKGFLPVAFATLAVSTARCRMKRSLLLGLRVPVVLVPWLLLCLAHPHARHLPHPELSLLLASSSSCFPAAASQCPETGLSAQLCCRPWPCSGAGGTSAGPCCGTGPGCSHPGRHWSLPWAVLPAAWVLCTAAPVPTSATHPHRPGPPGWGSAGARVPSSHSGFCSSRSDQSAGVLTLQPAVGLAGGTRVWC